MDIMDEYFFYCLYSNTRVAYSQPTLYILINYEFTRPDLQALLGEKEGRMSRVNLFYTTGGLHVAFFILHPFQTRVAMSETGNNCKSQLTWIIRCIFGNIMTRTSNKDTTQQPKWRSWVSDVQIRLSLHSYQVASCGSALLFWVMTKSRKWCEQRHFVKSHNP